MRTVDWGLATPERVFIPGQSAEPVSDVVPEALPEVEAARKQGFELAPEAPLWCFLPAVWPTGARAWVRDRSTRYKTVSCDGEPVQLLPWSAADHLEIEADINALLDECGMPARPPHRLWLLQVPTGFARLEEVLRFLVGSAVADGLDVMASTEMVAHVARDLETLFPSST